MNVTDMRAAYGSSRMTPQRCTIAEAAASMDGAFNVEALARASRARDQAIGTATVYRAVAALLASGWLERVGDRDGCALFAHCPTHEHDHHHHVVCDGCGRIEITDCPVAEVRGDSAADGFIITRHEVTFYGLCPECAERDEERTA